MTCCCFLAMSENCLKRNEAEDVSNNGLDAGERIETENCPQPSLRKVKNSSNSNTVFKSSSTPQLPKISESASNIWLLKKSASDMDLCFLIRKSDSIEFLDVNHSKDALACDKKTQVPKYFEIIPGHMPCKFNYNKIFMIDQKNKNNNNKQNYFKFKSAYNKALDSGLTLLNSLQQISDAALDCSDLVKESIRQTHYAELKTQENLEKEDKKDVVDYGLNYYDPYDDELMDGMLKDAFEIMRKDHKFVLASIPGAHRYPLIREWIRLRYGRTYNRQALNKSFQKSQPIFEALYKVGLPVDFPSSADIGKRLITDYSCHDYLLRKSLHVRNEFYKRLNKALLTQSRIVYFAMCPFLCCNGPLSNTIFAYAPAHKRDCYHFRPWKLAEFRKQKSKQAFENLN